jgi:hypothetical protein
LSLGASTSVLLGFNDAFVEEPCPAREFGDDVLRDCFDEVEASLIGTDDHPSGR